MAPKTPMDPQDRPRAYGTKRGKRRLSFAEAWSRRTTDASRARVMELYGRTAPPTMTVAGQTAPVAKGEDSVSFPKPPTATGPKPPSTGPLRRQRRRRRTSTGGVQAPS